MKTFCVTHFAHNTGVKEIGTYEVTLNIHPELTTQVAFEVVSE